MQEIPIHYDREQILQQLGIKSYVLKFWETEFDCLTTQFDPRGEVFYTDRDLALLQRIYQLIYQEKCSIERVRATLDTELKSSVSFLTDHSSGVMMESFPRLNTYSEQSSHQLDQGIVVEEVLKTGSTEPEYLALPNDIGDMSDDCDRQLLHQMALETMTVQQFDDQPLEELAPLSSSALEQLEQERTFFYHQRKILQQRIQALKEKLLRA
jgi:DNA-binding transcriptional MerR regulator